MDTVNISALVFSAIAAVAAVAVSRWEWLDRPQHAWKFRQSRGPSKVAEHSTNSVKFKPVDYEKDAFEATVSVFCEGSMIVKNVYLRPVGVKRLDVPDELDQVRRTRMASGDDPLTIRCFVPPLDKQNKEPSIEVMCLTTRPLRQHGERINLRNRSIEKWRWLWRSIRFRRRPGEGWWCFRLVRTQGRWVKSDQSPLVTIPLSEK